MTAQHALAALVAAGLAGQLCAVGYEIAIAGRFGTGSAADALALAVTLVVAIANEIVTWVSTLFLPRYVEVWRKSSLAAATRLFRRWTVGVGVATAGLAAVLVAGAPPLVRVLAPRVGAGGEGSGLLRLLAPVVVLLPVSVVLSAVLQAHRRFVLSGMRQLCWYGGALALLLAAGRPLGAMAVPLGMTAGFVVFCGLLAWAVRETVDRSEPPREPADGRDRGGRALFLLMLASAANYVNVMFERGIAARQAPGTLAALTYAFRLLNFPINLFLLNATTVLFPTFATHAAEGDTRALESLVARALRLALVFALPLAGLSAALGEPIIRVLLERGAFTPESTGATATALALYAPGIVGMTGAQVLARAYQALGEVGRLTGIGIAVIGANIVLMVTLAGALGFAGLPVASSVSALLLFCSMLAGLRRRLPGLAVGALLASASRAAVAAGAGAVASLLVSGLVGDASALGMVGWGGAAGVGTYLAILFAVARDDVRLAVAFLAPPRARRKPGLA